MSEFESLNKLGAYRELDPDAPYDASIITKTSADWAEIIKSDINAIQNLTGKKYCAMCKRYKTNKIYCVACLFPIFVMTYNPEAGSKALQARRAHMEIYPDTCDRHQLALFSTRKEDCLACRRLGRVKDSRGVRAVARAQGAKSYGGVCAEHGATDFSVQYGKCLKCYTTTGLKRSDARRTPGAASRENYDALNQIERRDLRHAAAKGLGLKYFPWKCPRHGFTGHRVTTGVCDVCIIEGQSHATYRDGVKPEPYR